MTKTILTIAAALFATSAAADHVYHGLAKGNSDLITHPHQDSVVGVQPGVGDSVDIYGPLGRGNSDLFKTVKSSGDSGSRPDIYQGFRGNPDLRF